METWDAITSRRDVREYTDESLGSQGVGRDSGGGSARAVVSELQPWDFVVVADREQLGRLSGVWQGAGHVARSAATVALVVPERLEQSAERAEYDLRQASMQMMLAAADLGIRAFCDRGSGPRTSGAAPAERSAACVPDPVRTARRPFADADRAPRPTRIRAGRPLGAVVTPAARPS